MTENYTIDWAKDHSMDFGDYSDVIDINIPKDFSIPNHPEYFLSEPWSNDVKIEITSFRGISFDAIHYYANIYVNQPNICKVENGQTLSCGGYICEEWRNMPKSTTDNCGGIWHIEVRRPLTQSEIEADPNRWKGYDADDFTSSFETKEEAIEVAEKVAAIRFPGRKIKVNDCTY